MIEGIRNRNRALEGDEIAVQILPRDQWKGQGRQLQQTGMVVGILKMEHHRQAVGTLKPDKINPEFALLSPRDSRVPRIKVAAAKCPPNYTTMPEMLYLAEIKKWDNTNFASGTLERIVGMAGSIETETESILMENGLEVTPYGPEMAKYYPQLPYTIPQEEIDKREDLREMCIFTIDPATARDLDDAVSYKALPGGECEVGVHISDVSHFLQEGTPLDEMVSSRATTTYLVQSVYHMLPYDLCKLCSLTPGEDKLAFSVLWRVSADGTIGEPRFTRSILLSCCQMSYEQAQSIIDAPADKEWTEEDLPVLHGGFTPRQVVDTVLGLQPLALKLREGRFQGGALRIDQPKLSFGLDPDTGLPDRFSVYQNMECHRLIEELMLMANMAVAKQLRQKVPDLALLRCHPPPHDHMLPELQKALAHSNIELDITNSGTMHTSLQKYLGATDHQEVARGWALSALLSKPMARAKYFCASGSEEQDQWHYALSVPLYTHFTSPIRRFADVIVHRLLAYTLSYSPMPEWHPDMVQKLASNCNGKKYSAKRAGEQSSELYLTLYVGMHGPLKEEAVVIDVKDQSFDVLVLRTGSNHRVYVNNFDSKVATSQYKSVAPNVKEITVDWKVSGIKQVIKLFCLVTVRLKKSDTELKIMASLCTPSK
ncbi:hypothetical protein B566_EDAN018024 [Ephemera danica]|nr:hypothetical protein B566_EDAN018024 [Ephemera danica]